MNTVLMQNSIKIRTACFWVPGLRGKMVMEKCIERSENLVPSTRRRKRRKMEKRKKMGRRKKMVWRRGWMVKKNEKRR